MPTAFKATVKFEGLNGLNISRVYDLGTFTDVDEPTEYGQAVNAITQIVGALSVCTQAAIVGWTLSRYEEVDGPGGGGGNVFENAMLNVYTLDEDDPTAVQHIAQHYIPAPTVAIMQGASGPLLDLVDLNDASLQQYVQQVSQHAFISDGETIQLAEGIQGMLNGRRTVRKMKLGNA